MEEDDPSVERIASRGLVLIWQCCPHLETTGTARSRSINIRCRFTPISKRGSSDFLTLNSGLARDQPSATALLAPQCSRDHPPVCVGASCAGPPIEEITSLATLVEFEAYKDGLRFFLERSGGSPPTWLSGMARYPPCDSTPPCETAVRRDRKAEEHQGSPEG